MNQITEAGLDLIKNNEGLRLNAYQDSADVWTIGYGHTFNVQPGERITADQAEAFLKQDLADAESTVRNNVTKSINDSQFSALTSLVFNIGKTAFLNSTLLRVLNQGDFAGAADQFSRWVYAGGQVLPGLVARRQAERALFLATPSSALRLFAPPDQSTSFWTVTTDREHQLIAWIATQLGLRYHDQQAQNNKLFLGLPLPESDVP